MQARGAFGRKAEPRTLSPALVAALGSWVHSQGLQQLHGLRTEVNAEPRSQETKRALPWDGVVGCAGREGVWVPGLQPCKLEQGGGCVCWEETLLIAFWGKDGK